VIARDVGRAISIIGDGRPGLSTVLDSKAGVWGRHDASPGNRWSLRPMFAPAPSASRRRRVQPTAAGTSMEAPIQHVADDSGSDRSLVADAHRGDPGGPSPSISETTRVIGPAGTVCRPVPELRTAHPGIRPSLR
jgi:hypothetical protein